MVIGLLASLFGCSDDPEKHGLWESFSLHRTSSVMTDAYHFTVRTAENGGMTVTGFCYEDGTEYRVEEEAVLSEAAVSALRIMELEKLPTYKPKKAFPVMDGAQTSASVTHTDGTERKIVLSDEQITEIVCLLEKEIAEKAKLQ